MRTRVPALVAAIVIALAGTGHAWIVEATPSPGSIFEATVDSNGDVLATGDDGSMVVTKRDGGTGVLRWVTQLAAERRGLRITSDAAGAVYAGGRQTVLVDEFLRVAKLSGADGSILWQRTYVDPSAGTFGIPSNVGAISIDPAGNVVAAGSHPGTGSPTVVVRLDAANGSELWQRVLPSQGLRGGGPARDVAVDATGDIFVVTGPVTGVNPMVTKLAGATGAVLWTQTVTMAGIVQSGDLALAGADPVIAFSGPGVVVRLDAATGTELWRYDEGGLFADDVEIGPDGNAYVLSKDDVERLDGATGTLDWATPIVGSGKLRFALDDAGGPLVVRGDANSSASRFRRLSAVTGAVLWELPLFSGYLNVDGLVNSPRGIVGESSDHVFEFGTRLPGRKLVVKETPTDPFRNTVRLTAKAPVFTAPASSDEAMVAHPQDPTVGGATLTIENPGTAEVATLSFPAANWTPKPSAAVGRQGYRYRDPVGNPGCRVALGAGKVKVACKGTLGGFTLDEPMQGSLRFVLTVGTGGPDHCLEFGGFVTKDTSTLTGSGAFIAKDAPAPGTCDGI